MDTAESSKKPRRRRSSIYPPVCRETTPLTVREQRFVDEYVVDLRQAAAARRAGYLKGAAVTACRLLARANVQRAVQVALQAQQARVQWEADQVLRELRPIVESRLSGYFDTDGNLKAMSDLTEPQVAALASVKVVKKNISAGDGRVEYVHEIKLWDKTKALELAMRHFGLLDGAGAPPVREAPVFALPPDGPQLIAVH